MEVKEMPPPKTKMPSIYVTAHCSGGNHEGTKNLSSKGALFPSCAGEYVFRFVTIYCTCWCHEMFREARKLSAPDDEQESFALGGPIPSMRLGNSSPHDTATAVTQHAAGDGYAAANAPTIGEFWNKVLEHQDLAELVFGLVSFHVFGTKAQIELKAKGETRRPRGALDINVEAVCRLRLEGFIPQDLNPSQIGLLIDPLNPPSAGAIHAVLKRWEGAGYCILREKPLEFVSFTPRVNPKAGITGAKKITERERQARLKGFF